jgi:uncharacterized SAM-binding protein YcdF (DUF218 family)
LLVFYALSKTLDVLLSPLTWAMLLLLSGLRPRGATWSPWRSLGAVAILFVFSVEPVSNALTSKLEAAAPRTFRKDVTYDVVILLGGVVEHRATRAHGGPSYNDNVERLLTTFDLLRTGHAQHALISGGRSGPDDPESEARVLGDQLAAWGIDRSRVDLEEQARNTRENATLSEHIARERHYSRVLVVTSAFHMPRAAQCFAEVGLSVDTLPVDYRSFDPDRATSWLPRADDLARSTAALRELAGQQIYRLVGYGKR